MRRRLREKSRRHNIGKGEKILLRKMKNRRRLSQLLLFLIIVPSLSGLGSAADSRGSFQLNWENDLLVGTDHSFTNGMKLTWVTPLNLVRTKGNRGNGASADLRQGVLFSIGQNIYTPQNIRSTALIVDDRPYAGMLFGELGIIRRTAHRMDLLSILAGVVGPLSQAEHFQKFIHTVTDSLYPMGWDHQLSNEFVFQLFWEQERKLGLTSERSGAGLELLPQYGLGVGNLYLYVHGGIQLRLGWNLPDDFGYPPFRPGGDSFGSDGRIWSDSAASTFGFFIFGGIDSQYVVRNMFLDGNLWTESHSVEKNVFVWNAVAGAGISFKGFQLRAAYAYWTKKFILEESNHLYGTIQLGFSF